MADGGNIENRIGDLIGSTFDADVGYAGDLINAAINEIADTISEDLLLKYSSAPTTVTSASGVSIEDKKILSVTRIDWNEADGRTKCFVKPSGHNYYNMDLGNGRGINTENPNVVDPAASYPEIVKQHVSGEFVYVFSALWNQAVLVPKSSDTRKNSFYSIQFKVESVKTSDETRAKVPSKFSINDINVIYREKGLR